VAGAGVLAVSGGSGADSRTPPALPGMPAPFLGTAVVGDGELTGAIDAYGDVVDLRARPGGQALIDNPVGRQAAGTVPADTGIVLRVAIGGGPALPLWRADAVWQTSLPGTNVVVTVARFRDGRVVVKEVATAGALAVTVRVWPRGDQTATARADINLEQPARCHEVGGKDGLDLVCGASDAQLNRHPDQILVAAARSDRRWLTQARQLSPGAPSSARQLYERSLLTLRTLTDTHTGASVAGARDGWAYVWPRDAGTAALALEAAGYRGAAQKVTRFLLSLDLSAARFYGNGAPVPGRGPQGDATGWITAAARATALHPPKPPTEWRDLPDYWEGAPGTYLGNALAAADGPKTVLYRPKSSRRRGAREVAATFETAEGLVRRVGDSGAGLDSAAAWAVEPFGLRRLYPAARETMLRLARGGGRFGITPGTAWPGEDPWTAPTAWTAWSLAALSRQERDPARARTDRRVALHLLADLRRAATPADALPERVDAQTGVPRSTTPLAWSHAFAILALLELWPPPKK
jgi:hypothetical protein